MTKFKIFKNIDTVTGICEECEEDSILVAIVSDYYRCTNCGSDTRQHVNGSIRYLRLSESDKENIKKYGQKNL
jgi:hypothetical protein